MSNLIGKLSYHPRSSTFILPKPLRQQVAPLVGAAIAFIVSLLPAWTGTAALPAWNAFILLLGFLYWALLPQCRTPVIPFALGLANMSFALLFFGEPTALHWWLSAQTIIAAIWLLRSDDAIELSSAGLMLGMNASAAFFIQHPF